MGVVQSIIDRLRQAFIKDKERGAELLAKGATSPTYPDSGFNLLQSYGYDALSDYLRLEHDLMCLSGDTRVLVLNDGVEWTPIRLLEEQYRDRPKDPIYTLSFDRDSKRVVCSKAYRPRKTKVDKVYYVVMVGSVRDKEHSYVVKATAEHPFLMRDGESYKKVCDLRPGDSVMPAGISLKRSVNGPYWYVFQPFELTKSGKCAKQVKLASLIAETMTGRRLDKDEAVHHKNKDKHCDAPWNLEVKKIRNHHRDHSSELWKDETWRTEQSRRIRLAKSGDRPETLSNRRLGEGPSIIEIDEEEFRNGVRNSASVNEVARKFGINWWTSRARMKKYDIPPEELGTDLNHKVVAILPAGVEDVYDLTVPEYENFAAEGVIVHNSRFVDYEEMDDEPSVASTLDIYADDASQPDTQIRRTIWVTSADKTLQGILDDLLYKRLRMDEETWEITRSLCKYGNDYEELLVSSEGVVGLNFLPAPTIRRVEGPRGELYGFVQDFKGRFGYSPSEFQQILTQRVNSVRAMTQPGAARQPGNILQKVTAFEPWEVVHMRLRGKHRRSCYGYSILEPGRWIWKRLMLLEDSALVYRLQRAPERYAFYIDVGDLPPAEALAYVNRYKQQYKKKRFVNPSTGKLDTKFESLSQDEDFFVPSRKGVDGTRIEVLGAPAWQSVDDIEYFQNKMFSALKVPKAYLAQDDSTSRSVLSSQDVRFARTVLRVQREIINGTRKITRVHLAALNIDPYRTEYFIHMTVPSAIFELAQLEVRNARADLASRMREHVSLRWILQNVYQLSDDDIAMIIKERSEDTVREGKDQAEVEKLSAMAQAAAERGVPGTESMDIVKQLRLLERKLNRIPRSRRKGITERELLDGDREAEKRALDKLDRLLRSNDAQMNRIMEIGALLKDIAMVSRTRR